MKLGGPTDPSVAATDLDAPPRPPERERDSLDGLLAVTLFPTVKPHRERLLDILRVIDGTQKGRELLYDFRTLAGHGRYPSVELAEPKEIQQREAAKPHGLFLTEGMLTAGASEIGLAPETEHAPSVVLRLTQIRNSLATRGQDVRYIDSRIEACDVAMDPIATVVAFRKELEASGALRPKAGIMGYEPVALSTPMLPGGTPIQGGVGDAPATPTQNVPGHDMPVDRFPCLPIPKRSTSHPYEAVTENADIPEDPPPAGGARRAFRWADQKVQAFRNFVLRRREPSGIDQGHRQPVPAWPGNPPTAGIGGMATTPASIAGADATSNAETPDRPIIKETNASKTSRHKRTLSIRNIGQIREQNPDTARARADTTQYARKETP